MVTLEKTTASFIVKNTTVFFLPMVKSYTYSTFRRLFEPGKYYGVLP
jgi:hypothetical protein